MTNKIPTIKISTLARLLSERIDGVKTRQNYIRSQITERFKEIDDLNRQGFESNDELERLESALEKELNK